jgi:type I restriction enzyme S subunit
MSAVMEVREPSAKYLSALQPPLVQHFELMATAPSGVARLRELILTLAVQGKLLPQDPSDEPASELLKKIRAEKDRLIAAQQIKRDKPLAEIAEEEKPFGLPAGWEWVRLANAVVKITDGEHLSPPKADEGMPLLTAKDVTNKGLQFEGTQYVTYENGHKYRQRCNPARGDVLICSRGTIGRCAAVETDEMFCLMGSVILLKVSEQISYNYLLAYLTTNLAQTWMRGVTSATAVSALYLKDVARCLIPVPPIVEQSRIVTRVEELMRLCDALETKGQLEAAQHAQLVQTLLGALTASATPDELADNWQRVATHFDLLLDHPEAIDALEQTILQLAVRGLLVPQDPKDEPARVLLQKICAEKDRLIAEGKVRRDKAQPLNGAPEQPFPLPPSWGWVRLTDICAVSGGATPSKAVPQNWQGSIPWVSPKDMKVPRIADAQDHVSDAAVSGSLSLIPSGSLLMVVRGMILAHSFPVAETMVPVTINQDMKALTPYEPAVLPFLVLACQGLKPQILALIDRSSHGTCKLESPKIFGTLFPLPPVAEQSRIVARVESLRSLCADLRQCLTARQTTQVHLAEALIDKVD